MKKQQKNSSRAWALQIALSAALLSISAVLLASSFSATPATSALSATTKPVAAGDKDLVIAGPVSALSLSPADAPFTFDNTGSLGTARHSHTATLLPNGKVLVAGGFNSSGILASAELYDPASGTWTATGSLGTPRRSHTATLLPNGKVLVAGGLSTSVVASAELYDPASGTWTATGSLGTARFSHTATLLPNGKVLLAGGDNDSGVLASAKLYDIGLGFVRPDWQPQIATATSLLITGTSLVLTGSRFQGISQASSGNFQDSSTNYPVVQLRAIDSSQVAFLQVDSIAGWSDTTFTSTPVNN